MGAKRFPCKNFHSDCWSEAPINTFQEKLFGKNLENASLVGHTMNVTVNIWSLYTRTRTHTPIRLFNVFTIIFIRSFPLIYRIYSSISLNSHKMSISHTIHIYEALTIITTQNIASKTSGFFLCDIFYGRYIFNGGMCDTNKEYRLHRIRIGWRYCNLCVWQKKGRMRTLIYWISVNQNNNRPIYQIKQHFWQCVLKRCHMN